MRKTTTALDGITIIITSTTVPRSRDIADRRLADFRTRSVLRGPRDPEGSTRTDESSRGRRVVPSRSAVTRTVYGCHSFRPQSKYIINTKNVGRIGRIFVAVSVTIPLRRRPATNPKEISAFTRRTVRINCGSTIIERKVLYVHIVCR